MAARGDFVYCAQALPEEASDEQLMREYVAGDSRAFRQLFERYAPQLTRAMLRELYVQEEANDLVQQTFLQLHRARFDFDAQQKLKPWLFTIAMNLKREYFRRKKRRPERSLDAELGPEPAVDARGAAMVDARRALGRALSLLPPDQRQVIELHWFDGLEFPEVAEVVGASVSAVKVRAHRGYVRLRQLLGDELPLPDPSGPGNRESGPGI